MWQVSEKNGKHGYPGWLKPLIKDPTFAGVLKRNELVSTFKDYTYAFPWLTQMCSNKHTFMENIVA